MASIYGCLVESYQNYGVRNWYIARIQQKSWKGGSVSSNRYAIKHSVDINHNDRALKTFRIFNTCQTTLATMSQGIYEDIIDSIRRDLDEHAMGLTEEVDRVIEEWETRGNHDDIRKTNTPPKVIFNARNLQADPMPQFNLVNSFVDKSNIRRRNPDALSQLKRKSPSTLQNGTAWVIALRILISQAFKDGHQHVSDAISDQTYREVTDSENARDEAAEAQKKENRKEMWGNILKVGLAVGGGILAWKLIDNLNSDNEDEDDDDRFDGPIMPPPPPPWMMQPPYGGFPGGYPGGYPGQFPPQPYPPGPQYPPPPQQPPVVPQPPPQQGPNFGRLLVDIKSKLQSIITLQRQLITKYINRTNSNMTEADKDNFRRTVAQIDGLVREVNPMIQMMENTPIPGNPNDLGTINGLHREVRQMIGEVEQNARQIQQFMGQMNLQGTGFAGPASAGTSPNLPTPPPPVAQPWNNPNTQAAINKCLQDHKPPLNQWGFPENPNIKQGMPPGAAGMSSFQYVWNNPRIRTCAQKG